MLESRLSGEVLDLSFSRPLLGYSLVGWDKVGEECFAVGCLSQAIGMLGTMPRNRETSQ